MKNHIVALFAVGVAIYTVCQAIEQFQWQNYNNLNQRYSVTLGGIPEYIAKEKQGVFNTLSAKDKAWIRSYFNLTSEEYYLYKHNLIPSEMWEKRILNGLLLNLKSYPALVEGFVYWKSKGAFNNPDDFITVIESQIAKVPLNLSAE